LSRGGEAGRAHFLLAVTSSAGKAEVLFEAGAHEVIVSADLDFSREVRKRTGEQGVDLALEIVGTSLSPRP
jgi:acryloyl-coenzyme A reductase